MGILGLIWALNVFASHAGEIGSPNAVSEEFWMLRNHLAPRGIVDTRCTLLSFEPQVDSDIRHFSQVLPGMTTIQCERQDCARLASEDGCFFFLRPIGCYSFESGTRPECLEHGRPTLPCIQPRCFQLEGELQLSAIEEHTVDAEAMFGNSPWLPKKLDIGLYRVDGVNH
jgi:hypothetical protein